MRILERIPLFCAESRPGFLARQPRAGMTETEPVGLHMVALFVERALGFPLTARHHRRPLQPYTLAGKSELTVDRCGDLMGHFANAGVVLALHHHARQHLSA